MFKKHMSPLKVNGKTGSMHSHIGKGARETTLPNRGALNNLVGSPQTPNNYAKADPMSAGAAPDPADGMGSDSMGPDPIGG